MGKAPVTIEEAKKPIIPLAGKSPAKSPNSDRYSKPNQVAAPLDPVEIIDKSTITLNREIYSRKGFNQTVGVDFEEFSKKEDTFSVTQFFQLYNALFFDIPRLGEESHITLKRRSGEFIRGYSAGKDPVGTTIDNLNDKILELEQQLLLANQSDPQHPFFRNGSLVLKYPGTNSPYYYMDKGFKRKVDHQDEFYALLKNVLGYDSDADIPIATHSILSQIKTGPNLSEGNFEQPTHIENGELLIGANVTDDTKDATINRLKDELATIKSGDFSSAPELDLVSIDLSEIDAIGNDIRNKVDNGINLLISPLPGFIKNANVFQELIDRISDLVGDRAKTALLEQLETANNAG
tara:strand:+ start:103 stop:1152 length:1050 start_codon:yes stop_codon:yes gene_type:complete